MLFRVARFLFAASLLILIAASAQTMSMPEAKPPATAASPAASKWPAVDGTVVLPDFRFGTGETLPQLRLHYLTLGTPHRNAAGHMDNAVLLLHGTGGSAHSLLNPVFSDVLFGPGAPLDITKYFLILPDDIGHGQSSKPSDGLHAHFPAYDYDDMVRSQRMMLDEMKIDHLRLILGTSMGCMQSFVWGETYPGFADALMPLACLPVQIAGRNRMMRYMAMEAIKQDPAWMDGEYKTEPVQGLRTANEMLLIMGSSPLQMQEREPTREAAEQYVNRDLDRVMAHADANDMIFQLNSSRNYDPSAHLDRITVPVMWINSADDFINPPELGIAEKMVKQMPNARFVLIPISDATRGHGTHTVASVWQNYLIELLKESEPKP
ncbi:Homoserine O-acetyltransferase [Candidatus Sulfotelmatomonas gaucii]|uniref:Homoserine O-acetyltransferase n=1 Tax=Candidatus Sulfuritelmatomonas gaucii TaxID=2043161 RepID=A0A2N9LFT8_9BACT|nr:Homoserine O-acetyltransferase [Candidatus Sulfotelmatomonas gaucii]